MSNTGDVATGLVGLIGNSSPSEKLITFGGLGYLACFGSNWLEFPKDLILLMVTCATVLVLVGFAGAVYAKSKSEEKELRMLKFNDSRVPATSTGDEEMLSILISSGPLREHDIFNLDFPYDDNEKEENIRGKCKMLRARCLVLGNHAIEADGDYTVSGSEKTVFDQKGDG
jgi:hypothetical protein